jgi:hypothetical protein
MLTRRRRNGGMLADLDLSTCELGAKDDRHLRSRREKLNDERRQLRRICLLPPAMNPTW